MNKDQKNKFFSVLIALNC